jgi:hypothetical protein
MDITLVLQFDTSPQSMRGQIRMGQSADNRRMQDIRVRIQNPRKQAAHFGPPIHSASEHFTQLDGFGAPA